MMSIYSWNEIVLRKQIKINGSLFSLYVQDGKLFLSIGQVKFVK